MMRSTSLLLAATAALAGTTSAQVQLNEMGYYPDAVTFATRVFIPAANTGDVTVRIDQGTARGVARDGRPGNGVHGLRMRW